MRKNISLIHSIEKPLNQIYIYGLCDPRTKELKYIGLSTCGFKRMFGHYKDCTSKNKQGRFSLVKNWIKSLKHQKMIFEPIYLEYFETDGPHVDEAEMFWISYFKMIGANLLNHDNGGRVNYLRFTSYENKRKLSNACKKANGTPEKRELFRQMTTEQWKDPIIREKRLSEMKNKPRNEQQKKNMRMGNTQRIILKNELGEIFNSMQEAADYYKVTKTTIQRLLYGKSRKYSYIKLERISGGIKNPKDIKFDHYYIKKVRKPINNPIIDQFGTIYTNITEASKKTGVSLRVVHRILDGEVKNPKSGYIFKRLKEI